MNLDFLGDAFDHWKGSLLESLQNAGVLTDLAVDPVASDLSRWGHKDFDLYARLLRVEQHQVLRHENRPSIADDRQKYFEGVLHAGDLFIDPDTGVGTRRLKGAKYVMPAEIAQLLDGGNKRIVAVYQHIRGRRVVDRVNEVLNAIRKSIKEFEWCSYESRTVAMLFFSRDHGRAAAVAEHFRGILGSHADGRIRPD